MRTMSAFGFVAALSLAATPALAQSITDTEANAMLDAMSTTAFNFCTDTDAAGSRPAIDQYNACQTAAAELAQFKKKNAKPTPGQQQVYGFFESALEMGNTYTMLRVDGSPTVRVCSNIEKQWTMAANSNPGVVGPELAAAFGSMKEAIRPLVKLCRERYPAPAGALSV